MSGFRDPAAIAISRLHSAFRDRLTDEEIELVLAFIKTMWTERQRRFQQEITRKAC